MKIKKILKMVLLGIAGFVFVIIIGTILFINLSPQFGGKPSDEEKLAYKKTGHYKEDKFINQIPSEMDMSFGNIVDITWKFIKGVPNSEPDFDIPVEKIDSLELVHHPDSLTRLTWFGHSTVLLEIDGKNILIDPVFSERPSPVSFMGSKRYSKSIPIEIEKLPQIDAVIISHDHYDHLDYESIKKLAKKVDRFYVPLAVGPHLRSWDIEDESITELDWWDEINHDNLKLVCAPARHFSGRGLTDRLATLWASWIVIGSNQKIYFSGDSGYGPHFKEIGEKYGPFDIAMLECGQYNKRWEALHMMPEQSAKAAVDVKTKLMMPIHWGAFTLALHSWTDPIERVTMEAKKLEMPIATPKIGESIVLNEMTFPNSQWWKKK